MVPSPRLLYKSSSSSPVLQSADSEVKMVNCPLTALACFAALLTAGAAVGNDHGCPDDWTPFGTRCFKFFDSKSTWTNAEKSCQSLGAHLASIHSTEENAFLAELTKKATGSNPWTLVGGHDAVQEGLWMWSDGSVWDYANWGPHEPSNSGGREHFAMINWLGTSWNDVTADHVMTYICAKAAGPKAEPEDKCVSLSLGNCQCSCACK